MDLLVRQDRATGGLAAGPRERQRRMDDEFAAGLRERQQYMDDEHGDPFESTEHRVDNDNTTEHENETSFVGATPATRQAKKKKKKMSDKVLEELNDIKVGIHAMAVALEKSCKSNLEIERQITQEIKKIEGMSFESRVKVYRALTYDEKAGKAFLGIDVEWRRMWLEMEFGPMIFDE